MRSKTNTTNSQKKPSRHLLIWISLVAVAMFAVVGLFAFQRFSSNKNLTQGPSPIPSTNDNVSKQPTPPSPVQQQSGTDLHGQQPSSGSGQNPEQWTKSTSGAITVKSPAPNSQIKNGDTLFGSATIAQIHYRLVDNSVGVVSQGTADVVDGNFSASISFQDFGKTGRLDVFSTDSQGRELNEVQINVTF